MEMGNLIPHHLGNYGTDAAQIACAARGSLVQQRSLKQTPIIVNHGSL